MTLKQKKSASTHARKLIGVHYLKRQSKRKSFDKDKTTFLFGVLSDMSINQGTIKMIFGFIWISTNQQFKFNRFEFGLAFILERNLASTKSEQKSFVQLLIIKSNIFRESSKSLIVSSKIMKEYTIHRIFLFLLVRNIIPYHIFIYNNLKKILNAHLIEYHVEHL